MLNLLLLRLPYPPPVMLRLLSNFHPPPNLFLLLLLNLVSLTPLHFKILKLLTMLLNLLILNLVMLLKLLVLLNHLMLNLLMLLDLFCPTLFGPNLQLNPEEGLALLVQSNFHMLLIRLQYLPLVLNP